MIERIRKKYAMTEKGAKDYVAAVFWSVLVNISKMLPVGVLATALSPPGSLLMLGMATISSVNCLTLSKEFNFMS